MDQDRLSSLAMCTIQRETAANKVENNDIKLIINNMRENFSDQMVIFCLTYCI